MSLANPDEEYENLVDSKHKKKSRLKGKFGNLFKKTKLGLILLIIGILVGIMLGHYYIEPLLTNESGICETCLEAKELLNKENSCLYELIDDPQMAINTCNAPS